MSEESLGVICPKCGSNEITHRKKKEEYICDNCDHNFKLHKLFVPLNIFLSYGHDKHAAFAERLNNDLKKRGHAVWFDKDRIPGGADWEFCIEQGLDFVARDQTRGRMILIMTQHSLRRPDGFCLNEVARAVTRKLKIIPIMLEEVEPLLSIARLQWLDMQECTPIESREEIYISKLEQLFLALEHDQFDFDCNQVRLHHLLEPISYGADIDQHLEKFTGRQWIVQQINKWLQSQEAPRIFWITGDPGSGKTALASWLCYNYREIKSFHLCIYGDKEKSDPKRCVMSIAYQLAAMIPHYKARLIHHNLERLLKESNAQTLFDILIIQSLMECCPVHNGNIVILIDALDEAGSGDDNELASFLASQFVKTPKWLRLIITSRPEGKLLHLLQAFNPFAIDAASSQNMDDIREFLKRELKLLTGEESVPTEIIETITSRSEGIFLYVEWVREELLAGRLSLNRLNKFPQGLGGIYAQYFRRQFPDVKHFQSAIRPALGLIFASQHPLDKNLLATLCNWESEFEIKGFVDSLGSLFHELNGTVQPFHKSIRDWLLDDVKAYYYFVSINEGHRKLASIGWNAYMKVKAARDPDNSQHIALSKVEECCLKELHYHLAQTNDEGDIQRLKEYITDIDVFVRLYWDNMYQTISCWNTIDDKSSLVAIYQAHLGNYERTSTDIRRIARAYQTIGLYLYYEARFNDAEPFLDKAVQYYSKMNDELMLATALNDLGECYRQSGKYEKAKRVLQQALDIRRRVLGDYHEDTADSITNYSHVFFFTKKYEEAQKLYGEAFRIRQIVLPPCHHGIAESYNNLGIVASHKGDKEKAVSYYRKAIEIMEKCGLNETWENAIYYANLGEIYSTIGEYEKAESAYLKAFEIRRNTLGWPHPDTNTSLNNLLTLYTQHGKTQQAEAFLEEQINILGKSYQPSKTAMLQLMAYLPNIAIASAALAHEKTESRYTQVIAVFENLYGATNPEMVKLINDFGRCYRISEKLQIAFDCYARSIRIGEAIIAQHKEKKEVYLPDLYFYTAVAYNEIAFYKYVPEKEWQLAEQYYRRAIDLIENTENVIEIANMKMNLQTVLHQSGKGVDLTLVKKLTAILENANDYRAQKGKEILNNPH